MSLPGWLNIKLLAGLLLLLKIPLAGAEIQLQQTRLVYPAGKSSVILVIKNSDTTHAVAIESWVESGRRDITITPATLIIKPGRHGTLNIHIPDNEHGDNQESLYWLNVKGIPLGKSHLPEQLAISVINRIKIFYRPQMLFAGAGEVYNKLNVSACGKQLTIKNPTPYYINFYSFKADDEEVETVRLLGPYETQSVSLPAGQHPIARWQAILDSGFHSPLISKKITSDCSYY